ncbi:MAG TPA: glutamate 5-kinase [Mycobacteriales bacterium]|nr:glutamate 5-kinase [Mycobacteriales bacterium]
MSREAVATARRLVVKVGSSSLTTQSGGLDGERLDALVDALEARGGEIVLVSSGAIAAGMAPLGLTKRPRDLATLQAAASVGQSLLVQRYATAFARHDRTVGQVLLTADDVVRRAHYRNARTTLERLLALGVVPVVNENDAVATQEIRFGDNDRLAALVAHLVRADALVLLSDVAGLYDGDPGRPGARLVPQIDGPEDLADLVIAAPDAAGAGTGGMASKVDAARIATSAGVPVLVAAATDASAALRGEGGTIFPTSAPRVAGRLLWLAHASAPQGRLVLDDGAVDAICRSGRSLLPAGVTGVSGEFAAGDPVDLLDGHGRVVARGLVGYGSEEVSALLGKSTREFGLRELVHRDDLVLLDP